ncbi:hypothetical protein [Methylocystis suflitae]|uniref:hypothetical protein n=1 Tax=Methylocystis suflitae TaxID=2951405 RepID=UPI00210BF776|nr:hypothetical protein [Methylocystis suflitae]MCQ4190945.1 hypothetical protein [Methylocystis suflitae]
MMNFQLTEAKAFERSGTLFCDGKRVFATEKRDHIPATAFGGSDCLPDFIRGIRNAQTEISAGWTFVVYTQYVMGTSLCSNGDSVK